jgi:Na/Pi-cotransporter
MSLRRTGLLAALLSLAIFVSGCGETETSIPVGKVSAMPSGEQSALPGEMFDQPLRIEVSGPVEYGILGSSGNRLPVVGCKVRLEPTPGSDLIVEPAMAETDAGGRISVRVKAGRTAGDHYLAIIPEGAEDKAITVRFITGMRIYGGDQEEHTGNVISDPIRVKVVDRDGEPAVGVPVYFRITSTPDGKTAKCEVKPSESRTDQNGEAKTYLKLGNRSGEYRVGVEIADPDKGLFIRGKTVRVLGIDIAAVIIAVLGGLTLFVFGMKLMGDGLQKIAGENMKRLLQFFARNGIVAVLAGTVVTAVIQSSSATTVMVIGFINAGLLTLTQSIGIIFGANVGTTITAQMISFNLSGLAMPAITLGFLISLSKRELLHGWGQTILGFGLLFFGMTTMSEELKMLGIFPSFIKVFQSFDCTPPTIGAFMPIDAVLGAILIGLLATVTIQSSSAAMGIVLALAGSGLINFYTAVPLLLGTNIGTTITAFLASFAANRVAKQAAIAHSMFNIFGTALMLGSFYIPYGKDHTPIFLYFINAITPGNVFAPIPHGIERHIAMAHTFFNVTVTVILLPFIGLFAHFCEFLLPIRNRKEAETVMLEPHLLATPSIALEQTIFAIRKMVADSWLMIDAAVNVHFMTRNTDPIRIKALAEAEEQIDKMQADVTNYLVQITRQKLSEPQSELVPLLMHCTNDAERIADHAENIIELTRRLAAQNKPMSEQARHDIQKIWSLLDEGAKSVIDALGSCDNQKIELALKNERKINKLTERYESDHIERLRKGSCNVTVNVIYIEMLGELEKIGDGLSNIAERTPEIQKHCIEL